MRTLEDLRANWNPYLGHVYGHIETIVDSGVRSLERYSNTDPIPYLQTRFSVWR